MLRAGATAVALLAGAVAPAAGDEPRPLAACVPADVAAWARWRWTDTAREHLAPLQRGLRELVAPGAALELCRLVEPTRGPEERRALAARLARAREVLSGAGWPALLGREVAVALRLEGPLPAVVALFRVPPAQRADRHEKLDELLVALAGLAPGFLAVERDTQAGSRISRLELRGSPVSAAVVSRGDVVALASGPGWVDALVARLPGRAPGEGSGEGTEPAAAKAGRPVVSLPGSPLLQEALGGLPAPREGEWAVDLEAVLRHAAGLARRVAAGEAPAAASGASGGGPAGEAATPAGDRGAARGVAGLLVALAGDGVLGLARTGGVVRATEEGFEFVVRTGFRASAAPSELELAGSEQEPVEHLLEWAPEDARGVAFGAGLDLARLHDVARGLLRWRVPDGAAWLARWRARRDAASIRLREDVLSWIEGGWGLILLPPGLEDRPGGVVGILRLRDPRKAERLVAAALEGLVRSLDARGHRVRLAPAASLPGASGSSTSMPSPACDPPPGRAMASSSPGAPPGRSPARSPRPAAMPRA